MSERNTPFTGSTQWANIETDPLPVTVSLPSNLAESFERLAKAESKNKSQLFREMLTTYERRRREERFLDLQRYGVKKARKKSILTEADVEKLVFQGR